MKHINIYKKKLFRIDFSIKQMIKVRKMVIESEEESNRKFGLKTQKENNLSSSKFYLKTYIKI